MSMDSPSEFRIDSLPDREIAVKAVVQAAKEFSTELGVLVRVPTAEDGIGALNPESEFRYSDQFQPFTEALGNGEKVTIATVVQTSEIIAFGFGEVPSKNIVEIMTIDVATASRRSAGVKSSIKINGESFEIGIAHVLVLALIESIDAEIIHTNATTAPARYIFKSLGFVSTDEDNSCLLRLEKTD